MGVSLFFNIKDMQHHTEHESPLKFPQLNFNDVDVGSGFSYFGEIIKLNKKTMEEVAHDGNLSSVALVFLMGGTFIVALCFYIFGATSFMVNFKPDLGLAFTSWVVLTITCLLEMFVASVIALKLFMGKGSFDQFFRVAGIASLLSALMAVGFVIPMLGAFIQAAVTLWSLVIGFVALKTVFKLDTSNTILTMILAALVIISLNSGVSYLGFNDMGKMGMGGPVSAHITC